MTSRMYQMTVQTMAKVCC